MTGRESGLARILGARSVAVVGASADPLKITGRPIDYMKRQGYAGRILPVNPGRPEIQGLRSYPSLAAIGEPVDLAIIGTAAGQVPDIVRDGIAAGIRGFLVFSSGFAEHDEEGAGRQAELSALAREHDVAIIGPNCLGVIDAASGLVASFTTAMENHRLKAGPFGFASQSGALGAYWLDLVLKEQIGFSKWITTGNECDVDVTAALEYLVDDEATRVIGLYVEDIKQPDRFRAAAQRAAMLGKPVIAIKAGRSAAGAAAAASHTGALAGADESYQALFDQYGIIRVRSLTEMIGVARLAQAGLSAPDARTAIMSVSGGAGVLIADELEIAGLRIAGFSETTRSALRHALPAFSKPQNPIDLTATVVQDTAIFARILDVVGTAEEIDAVILFIGLMESISERLCDALVAARAQSATPIVVVWIGAPAAALDRLRGAGIAVFEDIPQAVTALALIDGLAGRQKAAALLGAPAHAGGPVPGTARWPEWRSKIWLAEHAGLPVPRGVLIGASAESAAGTAVLSAPLVAKLQAPDMPHKSDHGGVRLGLRGDGAVERTVAELLATGERMGLSVDGVLVEEMVAFEAEFLVGLRRDPRFGPILLVGRGGVEVELTRDVKLGLLPLSAAEIEAMLRSLRGAALFDGYRGRARIDLAAIAGTIAAVAGAFLRDASIGEIEINPLVAGPQGIWALDALMTGGEDASKPAVPADARRAERATA